ncbi:MAG TPA: UDP-glucose 4-epimerase GalE [Alphaproteobacteria bacterium]
MLVTGGAGFVGSHTCKALWRAGYLPITYDNLSRGHAHAVRWGPLVKGEVGDRAALVRAIEDFEIGAVIHFAGYAYVAESMARPDLYFRNNFIDPLSLLDAMAETGVRDIIFSSTCATYGIPLALPIREDHPQAPISPYGESKRMFEQAVRWYGEPRGLRWASLRYFNAAGADPDGELAENHEPETHLIPLAIRAALRRDRALTVFGTDYPTPDGTAVRDFVHVCDLADAHVRALGYLAGGGDSAAFNLGTGHGHSVREIIAAVERVTGRTVPVVDAERRPGDPPVLVADASRIRAACGWEPTRSSLDFIIETALTGLEVPAHAAHRHVEPAHLAPVPVEAMAPLIAAAPASPPILAASQAVALDAQGPVASGLARLE